MFNKIKDSIKLFQKTYAPMCFSYTTDIRVDVVYTTGLYHIRIIQLVEMRLLFETLAYYIATTDLHNLKI